ncbi:MAG: hypothetical protein IJ155_01615 [Prevotella sp.]|nr:hypothetical protein [Prevotella sp.]
MEASYSISHKDSEYRILLTSVRLDVLSDEICAYVCNKGVDVSELIIERISGDDTTEQEVLHDITGWVADIFADNPNLVIYYSCDDMMPIPSRNTNSENSGLPVNEYRSRLFSHIFDTYMSSHQVTGITNTPIRLDNYDEAGNGYSIYMHLIARHQHTDIVEILKDSIIEVGGK